MDPQLVRKALKLFVAVLITAAISSWSGRVAYLWYPLLAVITVVDDNDDLTIKAASARILGTLMGGLVTFLVHSLLSGWQGVLVALLLIVPILRLFGWQAGLGTAGTVTVVFLMLPSHAALDWSYAFNRGLDTALGCAVALAVGLLFWPRNGFEQLRETDASLRQRLSQQLQHYEHWLGGQGSRPVPLNPAPFSASLARMEQLVNLERGGPRQVRLRRSGWERQLRLWQQVQFHWLAWERLLAALPAPPGHDALLLKRSIADLAEQLAGADHPTPRRDAHPWQSLARRLDLPLLPLLAMAEEWHPLHANLGALGRRRP